MQEVDTMSKYLRNHIKESITPSTIIDLPYNGWDELVISLHQKMYVLDAEYEIKAIYVDNGVLGFDFSYKTQYNSVIDAMYKYVQMARVGSSRTCIKCKKPGFISVKNNELHTLCKKCR